ncbi:MAG: ArgR family transcriptional regulator [Acidobacteria bacterium]|nr:ArgR family transcriptional regulator [Acidobacteriota bacterium]
MTKTRRQALLRNVVRRGGLRTQEELGEALAAHGVEVSQVTLSRDLRELGVVKTSEGYREPGALGPAPLENLERVVREFLVDALPAQNLVVLKTNPGGAGPVAVALDRAGWPEILGTVAGDDTIFVATASADLALEAANRLRRWL